MQPMQLPPLPPLDRDLSPATIEEEDDDGEEEQQVIAPNVLVMAHGAHAFRGAN